MSETLRGQVESIRLHRDSWGVMQLLAGSASERTTVVGVLLGFDEGDTIEVDGAWSTHPRWGQRFEARAIRVIIPTDASGAIAWIAGRMPAIGRRLATEMVHRYGIPGVWDVLEHEPARLIELNGITPERAEKIGAAYKAHVGERDRIVAFKQYGLTDRQIARIVEALGPDALETIRLDPYVMIEKVDGVGFKRADALALRMGLPRHHPSRIRAGLAFLLEEAAGAGHVYVPAGKLMEMAARLLEVDAQHVRREGRAEIDQGRMVQRGARVYSPALDRAEAMVAERVRLMTTASRWEGEAA